MNNKIKNYGLIPAKLEAEDWLFRSSKLGLVIRQPDTNWTNWLPTSEKQKRSDEDKMACVTFSALNTCETEFEYQIKEKLINVDDLKWLEDKGYLDENGRVDFNDAHIAALSGTTRSGNSPKNVADAIHKYGLVPEKLRPYRKAMTWNAFYDKSWITTPVKDLGQEFLKRFPVNYEFVNGGKKEYDKARQYNPLQVFVYAWNGTNNKGEYVKVSYAQNHAVENHNTNQIADTYEPFIKNLASDFNYMGYGIRFIIQFKKKGDKNMLTRKKDTKEVFLNLGGERYWIKDQEDFEGLKTSQPIKDIEWDKVEEVDIFTEPYNGKIIGSPNFIDLLKTLFGKIK